jgi:hypothetical protein
MKGQTLWAIEDQTHAPGLKGMYFVRRGLAAI